MWIMTTRGFYSVVEKPGDREGDMLTVRARNKKDIDALADLIPSSKPFQLKHSDYPWRLRCSRGEWKLALVDLADEVTYSNFKDEVSRVQGKARAGIYSRVWSVLLGLERRRPRQTARLSVGWDWDA